MKVSRVVRPNPLLRDDPIKVECVKQTGSQSYRLIVMILILIMNIISQGELLTNQSTCVDARL